ncbi:Speedy protein E4A, partial [Sciurus carolinensis]|nr:Speedy protein E4A [Sciurus carolinensis]
DDDIPGAFDSVPRTSSGLMTETAGQKRKRESSTESDEELEELDSELNHPWDVDSLCGLKMKLKKRRMDLVLPEHHEVFKRLLDDPVVKGFLTWDKNLRVSDKYLLSMVIAYFSRAGLFSWQYQRIHFFLALYLANDMEEDNQAPKQDIFYFLYGQSYALRPLFHKLRYQFICSMGWNTWVSLEECEEVGGAVCLVEGEGGADWRLRKVGGCRWDVGRRKALEAAWREGLPGQSPGLFFLCFSVSEPNVYLNVLYAI